MLDKLKTKAQQKADELKAGATGSYEASATAPNTAEVASGSKRLSYPLDDADYKARVIFSVLATEDTGIGDSFSQLAKAMIVKQRQSRHRSKIRLMRQRQIQRMGNFASLISMTLRN